MNKTNRRTVKWFLLLCLSAVFATTATAQDFTIVKGGCLPTGLPGATTQGKDQGKRLLPAINTQWDSTRVYRQLVILVSYSDCDFQSDDPKSSFNRMLNEPGYNQRKGPGCLADYFREQSRGWLNLLFDVVGPFKVDKKVQPYTNPTEATRNYGSDALRSATQMFLNENKGVDGETLDLAPYDWNGDKTVEQVIYVVAGLSGNAGEGTYGYLWPNTSSFAAIKTTDGYTISNYTASAEHWPTTSKTSCGIGTIAHEFSHSLGLPDIYPTTASAGYSMLDEWDLMDGGNFTNYGWCPPNYTPMERMLMGWLEPVELDSSATITAMKTLRDSGEVYRIKHTDSEWYLLENRQQQGWDLGLPGSGLVIYHVDYNKSAWTGNAVNNNVTKRRFELVYADNMDYDAWDARINTMLTDKSITSKYTTGGHMNSLYLSKAAYPLLDGDSQVTNNELNDSSTPEAKMNNQNEEGSYFLSKPITNIKQEADGTIAFDFMGGISTAISNHTMAKGKTTLYDLNGRKATKNRRGLLIERQPDGSVRKIVK